MEPYVVVNGVRHWVRVVGDPRVGTPLVVDDLEQLRRHLELPRIALLGISFGGDLAAEYTVAHPERVDRLILQGTGLAEQPPRPVPLADELVEVAAFLVDELTPRRRSAPTRTDG